MRRGAWSAAPATWAPAGPPSGGGRHGHRARCAAGARASAARADARKPAVLGRHARGSVHALALRPLPQGPPLSAAGLPALLFGVEPLQASDDAWGDPYLDDQPPALQLLLQARSALHRGAG